MGRKQSLRDAIISFLRKADMYEPCLPFIELILSIYGAFFFSLFRFFPIDRKKICFSSFYGLQYNGGPQKISEKLIGTASHIVWALPGSANIPPQFKKVRYHSIRYYYEMATAAAWVDNCRKDYWLRKRKDQLYIQTWHGPVCIKAVEKDAEKTLGKQYLRSAKHDSQIADYIVAESAWRKRNILNSFWYDGPIIEGEFKQEKKTDIKDEVKRFYGISDSWKLLVYLPTFRNNGSIDAYFFDYPSLLEKLKQKTGAEWCAVVRMHPNVSDAASRIQYGDRVFNGTLFRSADDLIDASDCVLTDYSGCIFDGFRSGKLVLLYAKDYDSYTSHERGLYFDLARLPAPLARNDEELYQIIEALDLQAYEAIRNQFVIELGYYDYDAAELCAEIISRHIGGDSVSA